MVSARSYGECEYWFSSIKVIAIVLFLGMGLMAALDARNWASW